MTTTFVRTEDVKRKTHLIDADGKILGRMCTRIATLLMGKDRPDYTAHANPGDFVVVVNAEKVRVTGNKEEDKMYKRYSGYPGGLKETSLAMVRAKHPEEIIMHAVKGMLPNSKLGKRMLTRIRVYKGPKHPHQAQMPVALAL